MSRRASAPPPAGGRAALRASLRRWAAILLLSGLVSAGAVAAAAAQSISIDLGDAQSGGLSERLIQTIGLITILSLAPSIVIMTTAFVRIVVVLSLLRTAIGLQQAPPNSVIIGLALFLTAFVMQPTLEQSWTDGLGPMTRGEMTAEEAWPRATQPVKAFMLAQTREADLALFVRLARLEPAAAAAGAGAAPAIAPDALPMRVVTPAFMISELRRAFEIGFLLFVPFLVIDLVVSSLLMAMGMMMLPPAVVSLPFKLIFFVLVDGWALVAETLVASFVAAPS